MARGKNNVQVTGDFILRAQMDIGNAEKQAQRIYQVLNNAEFKPQISKTFFTGLNKIETLTERIKDNLASGTLEGDGLKEYLRDTSALAKEMVNLERTLQKVGATDIKIDDSELKYLQSEIAVVEKQISDWKKGFTLDTTGILSTDRNLKQISESINKAIKNGESLQATLNNLSQTKQQDIITQTSKISGLEQVKQDAEQAIPKLEELLNKHRELEAFLQSPDKREAGRERFNLLRGEANEAIGSEFTSKRKFEDKRLVVAQEILRLEQEINAAQLKAKEADEKIGPQNKVLKDLREYQAVLQQIQAQNQGGIGDFDQEMLELQIDLTNVTSQARTLGDALAQALIKQLRDAGVELGQLRGQTKDTAGAMDDFAVKTKKEAQATDQATNSFKNKITQMFGLYNIYQLIRRGIQDAYRSIKELDQSMNEIAVVTSMTTDELWGQIETYMEVASQYGVATKGVYEVSKLYFQQGRAAADVTKLTAETLKMAKIAGLDYATATDHMTVALNGFKLSVDDAAQVVDVYSKLAAVSATDTQELAYAMSKTASIAESAGMSFENTTVFLAQMIETTREAPENIGTAMKTIIARFQEMKKSPLELVSVDGEEASLNRVDAALKMIGVSLTDASGQFRNLDEVIYELAGKWDDLDRNTQRYIATIVAGSRQQSRFLALMQDSDRLEELKAEAEDSEDAGLIQYYKTLDSIESKLNQLQTAFQQFYMTFINGPMIKGIIDFFISVLEHLNKMGSTQAFITLAAGLMTFKKIISKVGVAAINTFKNAQLQTKTTIDETVNYYKSRWLEAITYRNQIESMNGPGQPMGPPPPPGSSGTPALGQGVPTKTGIIGGFAQAGQAFKNIGPQVSGAVGGIGKLAALGKGIGQAFSAALGPIGAVLQIVSVLITVAQVALPLIGSFINREKEAAERIKDHQAALEKLKAAQATSRQEAKDIEKLGKKYKELKQQQEEGVDVKQELVTVSKDLAELMPALIERYDEEGNVIISLSDAYYGLLKSKKEVALQDAIMQDAENRKKLKDGALMFSEVYKDDRFAYEKNNSWEDKASTFLNASKRDSTATADQVRTMTSLWAPEGLVQQWNEVSEALAQAIDASSEGFFTVENFNQYWKDIGFFDGDTNNNDEAAAIAELRKEVNQALANEWRIKDQLFYAANASMESVFHYKKNKNYAGYLREHFESFLLEEVINQGVTTYEDIMKGFADSGWTDGIEVLLSDALKGDKKRQGELNDLITRKEDSENYQQELMTFFREETYTGVFKDDEKMSVFYEMLNLGLTNAPTIVAQLIPIGMQVFHGMLEEEAGKLEDVFKDDQFAEYGNIIKKIKTADATYGVDQNEIALMDEPTKREFAEKVQKEQEERQKTVYRFFENMQEEGNTQLLNQIDEYYKDPKAFSGAQLKGMMNSILLSTDNQEEIDAIGYSEMLDDSKRLQEKIRLIFSENKNDSQDLWEQLWVLNEQQLDKIESIRSGINALAEGDMGESLKKGVDRDQTADKIQIAVAQLIQSGKLTTAELAQLMAMSYDNRYDILKVAEIGTKYEMEEVVTQANGAVVNFNATVEDLVKFSEDYDKAIKDLSKGTVDAFSMGETSSLVSSGAYKLTDFDFNTMKFQDPEQIIKSQLKPIRDNIDQTIKELEQQEKPQTDEDYAQLKAQYQAMKTAVENQETELIRNLGKEVLNSFLAKLGDGLDDIILTASEVAQLGLTDTLKEFQKPDGTYVIDPAQRATIEQRVKQHLETQYGFDDDLINFLMEQYQKDAAEAQRQAEEQKYELVKSLAKELGSAQTVDGKTIIDKSVIDDLVEAGVIIRDQIDVFFTDTVDGWIINNRWQTEDLLNALIRSAPEQESLLRGIFDKEIKQTLADQRKEALDRASQIVSGFKLDEGIFEISSDSFELFAEDVQELFERSGLDTWKLKDFDNIEEFLKEAFQTLELLPEDRAAALSELTALKEKYQAEFYNSVYDMALDMFENVDAVLKEARRGGFKDKYKANIIASATPGLQTVQDATTGQYGFVNSSGEQVKAIDATEDFYKAHNINIKMSQKLVKEEHKGLKDLVTLQKQYAELQKEILKLGINQTDQQIAKQYQLAKAIASLTFDPETYSFMSNSPTNEKLSPIYALMDNVNQAFNQLNQAGQKDGTISNQDLNAILDYVDPTGDNESLDQLRTMARTIEPPMQIALDGESIGVLQGLIVDSAQKQVDDYNEQVAKYKEFLDAINSTEYGFDEGKGPRYYGEEVTDFSSLMAKLFETVEGPVLDQALQTAMKLLGPDFDVNAKDGQEKLVNTIISVLTTEGVLTDTQQEEAAQQLASSMAESNMATTNLTTAINALTSAITGQPMSDTEGTEDLNNAAGDAATQIETVSSQAPTAAQALDALGEGQDSAAGAVLTFPQAVTPVTDGFSSVGSAAGDLATKLQNITFPKFQGGDGEGGGSGAQGGPVKKSGKTLVGEFGPEIAFANGRYQILGARGPEFVNLPAGANVFNHKDTARILRRGTSSFDGDGKSLAIGSYTEKFGRIQVNIDLGKWLQNQQQPAKSGGGGGGGGGQDDKKNTAEFDRWYNYLQLIADVERAVSELQQARENLYGVDYTRSLAREIQLLQNQAKVVGKFKKAQETYLKSFEKKKIKKYSDYLQVVGGVLQIQWDKLNALDSETAEPIKEVIDEWESLKDSISNSTQELENFQAAIKKLQDEMRDTYIDVEKRVIEGIKYQQQMGIDNLQKQLDMKVKYDNKYLESLRKNIDKERKMRERSDQEEERAKLQRKLAMLKRDTSGKSALAISQAEEELRSMNRSAYDQRQDDFVQQEEDALLAAQEAIQEELGIQTEVMTFMNENVQLIQDRIDAIMASGPENLKLFLANWSQEYLNSTPTNQIKMSEEFAHLAGQVQGYLLNLQNALVKPLGALNEGLTKKTSTTPSQSKHQAQPPSSNTSGSSTPTPKKPPAPPKFVKYTYEKLNSTHHNRFALMSDGKKSPAGVELHSISNNKCSKCGYVRPTGGSGGGGNVRANQALMYSKGGLVDYTGPALVHGSKQKPESVLNPHQTGIFQNFVALLDQNFGKNIQGNMVRPNSFSGAPESVTVIVENITVESGVISRDYDARRAGDLVKEQILDIAKYKGNMTLKR